MGLRRRRITYSVAASRLSRAKTPLSTSSMRLRCNRCITNTRASSISSIARGCCTSAFAATITPTTFIVARFRAFLSRMASIITWHYLMEAQMLDPSHNWSIAKPALTRFSPSSGSCGRLCRPQRPTGQAELRAPIVAARRMAVSGKYLRFAWHAGKMCFFVANISMSVICKTRVTHDLFSRLT